MVDFWAREAPKKPPVPRPGGPEKRPGGPEKHPEIHYFPSEIGVNWEIPIGFFREFSEFSPRLGVFLAPVLGFFFQNLGKF